jgi:predicted RNA methylase
MKIKTVSIDADVEQVLRAAKLDGNRLVLQGQLMPQMYKKVMKVLELIGFKWNRSQKCHIGEGDSAAKLTEALAGGKVVDEKKTFQFFETPKQVASRLASLADIEPGHSVLEPSAGKGSIVRALQMICPGVATIHACELNPQMASDLAILAAASRIAGYGDVQVSCGDFLQFNQKFDRIVMNPPFAGGQDVEHVRHAYDLLNPGGRVVAIISQSWQYNSTRKYAAFKAWFEGLEEDGMAKVAEELPAGTFSESGTEIGTMILVLLKPKVKAKAA